MVNCDRHSSTALEDELDGVGVGVGDEGVFPLITFVSSTTRTFRKATFPSRARMIRISRNVHHQDRRFCFFCVCEELGPGWVAGRGSLSFFSTLSGAHGDMGGTETRSMSRLLPRSSKVRTSKKILVNLSRMVCGLAVEVET